MYKIVFSIPIHQRFEVVEDQIINYNTLNENCAIVLHVSQVFEYEQSLVDERDFLEFVKKQGNVFVNPNRLRTGASDIIQAHISNFDYMLSLCDFEYFLMSASNELFIRKGLYNYIKDYDAGANYWLLKKENKWPTSVGAFNDNDLREYLHKNGWTNMYGSQIEGSFYKKMLFSEITDHIKTFYDYTKMPYKYVREECYFSTFLFNLRANNPSLKILTDGNITWFPSFRKRANWDATIRDVKFLATNSTVFCVKRVDRTLNDFTRIYLRKLFCYYKQEVELGLGVRNYHCWMEDIQISYNYIQYSFIMYNLCNLFKRVKKYMF